MNSTKVKELLDANYVKVKKHFGQNFLLDENIIKKICDVSNIDKNTNVIEVGPGLGALTKELSKRANKVLCYEIDCDMVNILTKTFENTNVYIKHQDFLKAHIDNDIDEILGNNHCVLVSNLPYYITTAILLKVLEESNKLSSLTVMMQQEVANRICGTPSTKDYNSLSVIIQYKTNAKEVLKVGPKSFYPEPNVDSSVVLLTYKNNSEIDPKAINEKYFVKFNRAIFSQRRKTLVNNLKSFMPNSKDLIEKVLLKNSISLSVRSEALTVKQIVELANDFYSLKE